MRAIWMKRLLMGAVLTVLSLLSSQPTGAVYNNNPPSQSGFPKVLSGGPIYEGSPTLADLNSDGDLEIIIGGRSLSGGQPGCGGMVYAVNPNGSLYWERSVRAPVNSTPTVADLDGDGDVEVVVGMGGWIDTQCWNGGVIALNGQNGNPLWTFDTQDWLNHAPDGQLDGVYSTPAVGDVDRDGDMEITFGSWDQCVYLLDHNGNPVWGNLPGIYPAVYCGGHGFYNEDTIWSSPSLGDMNGDGTLEIVIGADISAGNYSGDPNGGYLYVLNHQGAVLARRWIDQVIYSSPALGDIDNDGALEAVVGAGTFLPGTGYYVRAYDFNPALPSFTDRLVLKWQGNTTGRVFASPALGDLDGNNILDVVVTSYVGDDTNNSRAYAWRGDNGAQMWNVPICDWLGNSFNTRSSPVIADIVGGSTPEVLFSHSWEVTVLNSNGTYYSDYSTPGPGVPAESVCARGTAPSTSLTYWARYSVFGSPAVGNLDNDSDVEVVIGGVEGQSDPNQGTLYVWTGHKTGGAMPWPMFHHDARHSGLYPRPGVMSVSPSSLYVLHQTGPGNESVSLLVRNTGDSPFTVNASPPTDVSVSPVPSTVDGQRILTVTVTTSGYGNGTHPLGSITLTGGSGGPINVPVTLYVGQLSKTYLPIILK